MNGSELQRLMALGVADLMTAQHTAVPVLDCCHPGIVGPEKRAELQNAMSNLFYAAAVAKGAAAHFEDAAKMLADFLRKDNAE